MSVWKMTVSAGLCFFFSAQASAADWVLIDATQNFELEIDRQSVRPNVGAWFKFIYTPAESDSCAGKDKKKSYSMDFVEANCKAFTIRTKRGIVYDEDGSVLSACDYGNPKAAFSEYAPETLGETLFRTICDARERVRSEYATKIRESKLGTGNKPMFAACNTSADCARNTLCKRWGRSPGMVCIPPDLSP